MEAAKELRASDEDLAQVEEIGGKKAEIITEIKKVIVGQDQVIEEILIALFCRGHCFLVAVPGLAKTLLIGEPRFSGGRFHDAIDLFERLSTAPELADFLTLPAYDVLIQEDRR